MNTSFNFLFFISTFLIISKQLLYVSAQTTYDYLIEIKCSTTGLVIKYPFELEGNYDPGNHYNFDLSCNNKSQTIINLPMSGDFIVKRIDYTNHAIFINDENSCLPNKMRNFNLLNTPFKASNLRNYKFVNCSSNWTSDAGSNRYIRPIIIACLSGKNHSIYAVSSRMSKQELPSYCDEIDPSSSQWSVSRYWSSMDLLGDLRLVWNVDGPSRSGHPTASASIYIIIFGVGIITVVLIFAVVCYNLGRIKRHLENENPAIITLQPVVTLDQGLDGRIIESYPKTELGESGRLPKPNDTTCPICLCEYKPKETLRSIPECNHYFHANCIDEWLKLNGTCPLCRNSSESLLSSSIPSLNSTTSS